MSKPLVTVAISFYNNQDTLKEAIQSVLNQTFADWELILIDDGSTDNSLKVANTYSSDRVTVITDGTNRGFVARLNQSVKLAAGSYYARMDADDIMHPERLMHQVHYLLEHPDIDAVDTNMYVMDQAGRLTGIRSAPAPHAWTLKAILHGQNLNHATVMGRIDWFKSNFYDPLFIRAEDIELWCRAVSHSKFARLDKCLYFVREGKINVNNYRIAQSTLRRIYRMYGPGEVSWFQILLLLLKSHAKSTLYVIMGALGLQEVLTTQRNTDMSSATLLEAQQYLAKALAERL